MSDITSGTVNATPLGDIWLGTIEYDSATDGDILGIQHILGKKIGGIVWARENTGTEGASTFSTTSGSVTLVSTGSTVVKFIAKSKAE